MSLAEFQEGLRQLSLRSSLSEWDCLRALCMGLLSRWGGYLDPPSGISTQTIFEVTENLPKVDPEQLADLYPQLQAGLRAASGAFYTPPRLVEYLLEGTSTREKAPSTCDPTCGTGHFLAAALEKIDRDPEKAEACLFGVDLDPIAVEVCRLRLWKRCGSPGKLPEFLKGNLRCGNALLGGVRQSPRLSGSPFHWFEAFPRIFAGEGGFDRVVGNPPFLNQLQRQSVLSRDVVENTKLLYPGLIGAYTDVATLLLYRGMELLRPGGRLGMVQPQSVLVAKDAAAVRQALLLGGALRRLWYAGEQVFKGAEVLVCAVVLERGGSPGLLERHHGATFSALPHISTEGLSEKATWSGLIAEALGLPPVRIQSNGTLGERGRLTADFRDEYYGLAPFVIEQKDADEALFPRLMVSGLIDPAESLWGRRPMRYQKRAWTWPRVDLAALQKSPIFMKKNLAIWAERRLQPKLLIATQTPCLEVVADPKGAWLSTTPTLCLFPKEGQLWKIAAVLLSPVASAWALENYGGGALSAQAIKLSARQLALLPLPEEGTAWEEAAQLVEEAHGAEGALKWKLLGEAARRMIAAYQAEQPERLFAWWWERRG